jgi:hypothetical protein
MAFGFHFDSSCQDNCVTSLLAEQWNGSAWSVSYDAAFGTDIPTSQISCPTATFCMENTGAATMSWDGHAWRKQPGTRPDFQFTGLSCGSPASCILIGDSYDPATGTTRYGAQAWNGTTWQAANPVGTSGALETVSCASATNCITTGSTADFLTMAQAWNGTSWKLLTPVNP